MWELPEARTAAGELVAGLRTDQRSELSFAVLRRVPPPFFLERAAGFGRVVGLRRAREVGRGLPAWRGHSRRGRGGGGGDKGLRRRCRGWHAIVNCCPRKGFGAGLAVAEGRLLWERMAAGALRPARATFIV